VYQERANDPDTGTASGTIVMFLNKGDEVHVQAGYAHMFIGNGQMTTFSGFLIK